MKRRGIIGFIVGLLGGLTLSKYGGVIRGTVRGATGKGKREKLLKDLKEQRERRNQNGV